MKIEYYQGDNVVSIQPLRTRARFPALAQIESYWQALRDGRAMPGRAEVDPRGLSDVIDHAFALEEVAPGFARIRIAGAHLNELMGMDLRGLPITALLFPETRQAMRKVLTQVLAGPATAWLGFSAPTSVTCPPLEVRMFLAPLRDDAGRPSRVLGAIQAAGRIGQTPRRLDLSDARLDTLPADAPRPQPMVQGFAEPPAPFAHKEKPRERAAFQLVVDNPDPQAG